MKQFSNEGRFILTGLFLFLIFCVWLAFASEGTYETGDSIQHYLISKYAIIHPELYLDHWGKPFYTLISSPFSQFGFKGICIFNALCATLTAWVVYSIGKLLNIKRSYLLALFSIFAPIYFVCIVSGLTELFFSLILCSSILLFLKKKYYIGAMLISFLPFVRTEGFFLLPLFAIPLLPIKNWKAILLLSTGTIIYTIIGGVLKGDFLWILNQNPYQGAKDIYGSGSVFHFISNNEFILGTPLVILLVLGLLFILINRKKIELIEWSLIIGTLTVYLTIHSIFWWKGLFGSLGLIRVMAAVTPLAAIIALRGLNFIIGYLPQNKSYSITLTSFFSIWVVIIPFKQHEFPRPLDKENSLLKETCRFISEHKLAERKIFAMHPYIAFFLNKDPFDNHSYAQPWMSTLNDTDNGPSKGSLLVWDSRFSPNEGRLKLSYFKSDEYRMLFTDSTKTYNKRIFKVSLFERL